MRDLTQVNELSFQIAAARGRQLIESRHNLGMSGVALASVQSQGDGSFYGDDEERQEYLEAGDIFDSAPVGP